MTKKLNFRFWLEAGLSALTALLLVVTLISHEWIELLFKVDPDGGSGELEWLVFAVLLVISLITFFMARTEWRRAPATA